MRVFIAGATGTLGRPVAGQLIARGHEVIGLTRSPERAPRLVAAGVHPVVGDALDALRMMAVLRDTQPDVVVHLLTALPAGGALRASQLQPTNELRTKGTGNLLRGAIAAGARRFMAESFVAVHGSTDGPEPVGEDAPLAPVPEGALAGAVRALRSLEEQLLLARESRHIETTALRIGYLYGADVPSTQRMVSQARAGRLFVPRPLTGVGPFVHVDDAASAIVAAIERAVVAPVYHVVDDEPLGLDAFVDALTSSIGMAPAKRLPAWVVRLVAPLVMELGSARLILSNSRARRDLGWAPRYPTVSAGLRELVSVQEAA